MLPVPAVPIGTLGTLNAPAELVVTAVIALLPVGVTTTETEARPPPRELAIVPVTVPNAFAGTIGVPEQDSSKEPPAKAATISRGARKRMGGTRVSSDVMV